MSWFSAKSARLATLIATDLLQRRTWRSSASRM